MDHLTSQIAEYVIHRTNLTQDYLNSIREKKKDIYFTATDAVELGIAVFPESIEKD